MAGFAGAQAALLAANIRTLITGEGELTKYERWPTAIVVPLGPEGGAGQLPGHDGIAGPEMASGIKGRAMLVDDNAALFETAPAPARTGLTTGRRSSGHATSSAARRTFPRPGGFCDAFPVTRPVWESRENRCSLALCDHSAGDAATGVTGLEGGVVGAFFAMVVAVGDVGLVVRQGVGDDGAAVLVQELGHRETIGHHEGAARAVLTDQEVGQVAGVVGMVCPG